MKYKRYLSVFLASAMAVSNAQLNTLADVDTGVENVTEVESENTDFSEEEFVSEEQTEETTTEETTEEVTSGTDEGYIEETTESNIDEDNTENTTESVFEEVVENLTENNIISDYVSYSENTLDDGKYTADISFLNENIDTESMAGRYFNGTQVPVTVENGLYQTWQKPEHLFSAPAYRQGLSYFHKHFLILLFFYSVLYLLFDQICNILLIVFGNFCN